MNKLLARSLVFTIFAGLMSVARLGAQDVKFDSDSISGLGARNIGAAVMSGRIAALAAVHDKDRLTVYVGSASGGVWKSVNGGTTFKPVFDKQPVQSIGAVTIDPTNPKVVWVGTGETWARNSVSVGDGIYKSTDAGRTWQHLGLRDAEQIGSILVDPKDANRVFVGALGHPYGPNTERGVYRSLDGGQTWQKVLYKDDNTGAIDLVFDPRNSQVIFADMWASRRPPWTNGNSFD